MMAGQWLALHLSGAWSSCLPPWIQSLRTHTAGKTTEGILVVRSRRESGDTQVSWHVAVRSANPHLLPQVT